MAPRIPLLFGTATFGADGKNGVRIAEQRECQGVLDVFFGAGHRELDTSRTYGEGTTEEMLGKLDLRDAVVDTKVYPNTPGDHSPANLRGLFLQSLKALGRERVRTFYLHAPDRSVPFEETVAEVNRLHSEGRFEIFGLSNFASWEVAEIIMTCRANNWVQPRVYQVMYNAITREMEDELAPCCRKFGLRIVTYNPLAGGLFAGKVSLSGAAPDGGRFDPSSPMGQLYRSRYVQEGYLRALELLKPVADAHNLRLTEIALRWLQHHSDLSPEDGVILGASSAAQLAENCADCERGPLPEAVVQALDEAQRTVKVYGHAPRYWR